MSKSSTLQRDNNWLLSRLDDLWTKYFTDVSQENPIVIRFGRYSKYRLGSIKLNKKTSFSLITLTSMFKDPKVPVEVIDHTISHEMVHYAHGFSSNKRRMHRYPHEGGVVHQEMERRGLSYLTKAYKDWIKLYRQELTQKRWK